MIEAARRQCLTGELTLPTNPSTKIYLRDGAIYFAERSSDGGLPIRLMMEGVINREQMKRGTVIVNGVEHVGRMFDNDPTIDRASVELCAELFTDDVMIEIANEQVSSYELVLYRRHPSGIDRWYPQGVPVFARSADSSAVGPVTTHESIEEAPAKSSVKAKAKTEARPEPKQEPKPEAKAEPKPALKNKLNAPPDHPGCPDRRPGDAAPNDFGPGDALPDDLDPGDAAGHRHVVFSADAGADGAGSGHGCGVLDRARRIGHRRRGDRGDQARSRRNGTPVSSWPRRLAKKALSKAPAVVGQHTAGHRWTVVQARVGAHL